MRFKVVFVEQNNVSIYTVSIKHALGTVDCGLWTTDYGLGVKHGLRYKTWTKHYALRTRHKTRT